MSSGVQPPARRYLRWARHGVSVAVSQRAGGVSSGAYASFNLATHVGDDASCVARNREALADDLGWSVGRPVQWLNQVHGDRVLAATPQTTRGAPDADAAWVSSDGAQSGVALAILTADCLPVVLVGETGTAFGVAHCGWRGLAAGLISTLAAELPQAPVAAYLGPSIGACCYQVDDALLSHFPDAHVAAAVTVDPEPGKVRLSLTALARAELASIGVELVEGDEVCCRCDERFFSYRRAAQTGRFATLAWVAEG